MNTALVPLASTKTRETALRAAARHPGAGFLAHLIAMASEAPQTRARRRAQPCEAIAAYAALGQWPIPPGRALSRSL